MDCIGGYFMKEQKTRCEKALKKAFELDAQAFTQYQIYAQQAQQEGFYQIARLFETMGQNKKGHAEIWLNYLNQAAASTLENLQYCIGELFDEKMTIYLQMAQIAQQESLSHLANTFVNVSKIESLYKEIAQKYYDNLQQNTLYQREEETCWLCLNCGHLHFSQIAPSQCVVCSSQQGYLVEYVDRY